MTKTLRSFRFNLVQFVFIALILFISTSCKHKSEPKPNVSNIEENEIRVTIGADRLFSEFSHLIDNKNIALVSNHSGRLSNGTHLADTLANYPNSELLVLFGMNYNIRSNDYSIPKDKEEDVDVQTGLPKYSLYGRNHKPTQQMLKDVDVIIFDIQEVGARFYEHINILGFVMEAAAENDIEVIVLDRPNPITGTKADGFLTDNEFLYGFGAFGKVPVIHGMTIGEIAALYNGEQMLRGKNKAKLHVVQMIGWKRSMWYDETGLEWVKPSPNLPTLEALIAYTGTCLFEGLNVSAGRGTDKPFQYIGAPWIDNTKVVSLLNEMKLKGVQFDTITFVPKKMPFHSRDPYLTGETCKGIFVKITDRDVFEPYKTGVAMTWSVHEVHPDKVEWNKNVMNRLVSSRQLENMIYGGAHPAEIFKSWEQELMEFRQISQNYLLY